MSAFDEPVPAMLAGEAVVAESAKKGWVRVDHWLTVAGERLNPILVKEARQALKSKQFVVTFTLVLACGWVWSMLGVAIIGPNIYYGSEGANMFAGYYLVLAFALLVIVPFGAFRSLASEREDGTFELLSVTTLRPRQVISGKLGSAVLQMLVYLSAISPCLAFTYMLRGIDFPTILFVMLYTFLTSLALSLLGLVVATATQERHWQVVLSVLLISGLVFVLFVSSMLTFEMLGAMTPFFQDADFWIGLGASLTAYASYFVMLFLAAAAQLTFASDNRSTALRVVMIVQQALLTGWIGWMIVEWNEGAMFWVFVTISGIHWYVMGVFMNGELGEISDRVKRSLPQSFLGRSLLTWFNPGPATGYMFALASLASALIVALLGYGAVKIWLPGALSSVPGGLPGDLYYFALTGFSYVVVYLGLGRLLVGLLRRFGQVALLLSVLVQLLLLVAGTAVPLTIHLMTPDLRNDWSLLEISNPFWTLVHVVDFRGRGAGDVQAILLLVGGAASFVFLLNLRGVALAVEHVRVARPQRVAEEDAELEAQFAPPPQPAPTSPWD